MTDGERTDDDGARQALLARAGNYVLGLMDESERRTADADLQSDVHFRAAVQRFADRMRTLDESASAEPVPAGLWERIAAAIEAPGQSHASPRGEAGNVRPVDFRPRRWRHFALAASLLAACGIGYLAGFATRPSAKPTVLVVLQTPANEPGAVFEAFADNSVRILPLEDFVVPDGKIMQVWTLYDKAVGPVSLGTLPKADVVTLAPAAFPRPAADQLYEITLEPAPGSPTGKPTGPILVKGFAKVPAG